VGEQVSPEALRTVNEIVGVLDELIGAAPTLANPE
jgi:hypothetical protein